MPRHRLSVLAIGEEQVIDGAQRIGRVDGLYVEPSSGVVVPAIERLLAEGTAGRDDTIVALLCGSGFRETFAVMKRRKLAVESRAISDLAAILGS